jgi:hypothetical protein
MYTSVVSLQASKSSVGIKNPSVNKSLTVSYALDLNRDMIESCRDQMRRHEF